MYHYSDRSLDNLNECHPALQRLFKEVIKKFNVSIITGHRGEKEQNNKYEQGLSQVQYPNSMHNQFPSLAVDVAPYPIDYTDTGRYHLLGGYVLGLAHSMGITLRWGGDWDMDMKVQDNSFDDLMHFELVVE